MHESFINDPKSYVWLVKPCNLNRGRGIKVFNSIE